MRPLAETSGGAWGLASRVLRPPEVFDAWVRDSSRDIVRAGKQSRVVLENSNVTKLASTRYLSVHSLSQEDCYDTDDTSARERDSIFVSDSTLCTVQSSR
jgi:hypothetical protein